MYDIASLLRKIFVKLKVNSKIYIEKENLKINQDTPEVKVVTQMSY